MSNQKKVILISRQTYWGEQELVASEFPTTGTAYRTCCMQETTIMGAQRRFNDGQAVYVNGLRFVKAGVA